jgi:tetratricopeptide (TPR) repeat protein
MFLFDWDWRRAEDEIQRALKLDRSNGDVHRLYAHLLSNTGRHGEALREADEALRLDPLSLMTNTLRVQFLLQGGKVDAAIAADKQALEIDSNFWVARMLLGNAYVQKAMVVEALEEYRVSYANSAGATEPRARTAHLLAITGREQEARKILAELTVMSKGRYVPPYNLAMIHAGLGERADAVRELHRACTERDVRLVFIGVEPLWKVLYNEPGWADVERCVNLPQAVGNAPRRSRDSSTARGTIRSASGRPRDVDSSHTYFHEFFDERERAASALLHLVCAPRRRQRKTANVSRR